MLPFERRSNKLPRPGWLALLLAFVVLVACPPPRLGPRAAATTCTRAGRRRGRRSPPDGWTGSVSGSESVTVESCPQGGALLAALRRSPGRVANNDSATWEFSPPAGERLVGATLWRAGDADGGANAAGLDLVWLAGPEPDFQLRRVRLLAQAARTGSAPRRAPLAPGQPRHGQSRQPRRQPLRHRHLPGPAGRVLRRKRAPTRTDTPRPSTCTRPTSSSNSRPGRPSGEWAGNSRAPPR